MQRPKILGLPRAQLALLALLCALGLLACALDGGAKKSWSPVAPQEWQKERGPVVPHDSFPADCSLCHEGSTWHAIRKDFRFDHAQETGVPLVGAHATAECLRCHNDRGPVAVFARQGCGGCHEDQHRGKQGAECATCHTDTAGDWRVPEVIAKHARTRFPLVGAHAAAACWTCHPGAQVGEFVHPSVACVDCHTNDLARATDPDHQAQGWVDGCERCHLPTAWSDAGFAHDFFPLSGGHDDVACSACHPGNVFQGTPTNCSACHADDYAAASDPDHGAAGFGTGCEGCHTIQTWSRSSWPHTPWPINGAHVQASCTDCHVGNVYPGTQDECIACHASEYQGAPDHVSGNFPTTCQDCHTTATWHGGQFSHQGILDGCSLCHLDDYQTAENHVANNYPTSCEQCHNTQDWGDANFKHGGITSGCFACHSSEYQGAPNHVSGNFPTSCEQCHTTSTWQGASFNHRGIKGGCVDCHQSDYQGAPRHASHQYPTTCQMCHTTSSWNSSFSHPQFPIFNGDHSSLTCGQCHPAPRAYTVFTCISCHTHSQTEMNDEHQNVPNYVYESGACYTCHPNGHE